MPKTPLFVLCLVGLLSFAASKAQTLPPPSRTVFKCEEAGRVVYSDSPCLGAKRVNIRPVRGLNKLSGAERLGADVRQERLNEQIAEAYKPIFGETVEQRAKRHQRARLSAEARNKCDQLDIEIRRGKPDEGDGRRMRIKGSPFSVVYREEPTEIVAFVIHPGTKEPGHWL